jgi:hypothetical protein
MKNKIFAIIIFCISNLMVCAQEKSCYNDSIFRISKDEMVFNTEKYKTILEHKDLILFDNTIFSSTYTISNYSKKIINTKRNKLISVEKKIIYSSLDGKIESVSFNNYTIYNGNYSQGVNLFKEYTFDTNGNITETIDNEKGYAICWQEAIEICKKIIGKRKLKKYNIKTFAFMSRSDLNKNSNITPSWSLRPIAQKNDGSDYENEFVDKYFISNKGSLYYRINGVTGKLLKKITANTEH